MPEKVTLEKDGVRIAMLNQNDIDQMKRLGYEVVDTEEVVLDEENQEIPEVQKAAEALEVLPADLATFSDEEILAVEGIGVVSLEKIRDHYPLVESEEEGEE